MLPSMPILSGSSLEDSRSSDNNEANTSKGKVKINMPAKILKKNSSSPEYLHGVSKLIDSSKKSSPLKHVTPILKKYTCQRKAKESRMAAVAREMITEQIVSRKPTFRPIAPKPNLVCGSPTPGAVQNSSTIGEDAQNGDEIHQDVTSTTETDNELVDEDVENMEKDSIQLQNGAGPSSDMSEETHLPNQACATSNGSGPEIKDNEADITALMNASTKVPAPAKVRNTISRKKSKQLKDLETTLNILSDNEEPDVKEEKDYNFALAYFNKVQERLKDKDPETFKKWLETMNGYGETIVTVPELYHHIVELLKNHKDLADEFLAFLLPEQAMECGRFMDYLLLTKMKDFFYKLEKYFAKQPHQMRKVFSALTTLSEKPNVTIEDIRSSILPLLKGNTYLIEKFQELLPQERPPESLVNNFEHVTCYEDTDVCEDDLYENIDIPEFPDPYGGDNCICPCHNSDIEKFQKRVLHCIPCGTKFIHGRVYVQTGKGLRQAKIVFNDSNNQAHIERLKAKGCPPKGRRRRKSGRNASPVKAPQLSPSAKDKEEGTYPDSTSTAGAKLMSPKSGKPKSRPGNKIREKNVHTPKVTSSSSVSGKHSAESEKDISNGDGTVGHCKLSVQLSREVSKSKDPDKTLSKKIKHVDNVVNNDKTIPQNIEDSTYKSANNSVLPRSPPEVESSESLLEDIQSRPLSEEYVDVEMNSSDSDNEMSFSDTVNENEKFTENPSSSFDKNISAEIMEITRVTSDSSECESKGEGQRAESVDGKNCEVGLNESCAVERSERSAVETSESCAVETSESCAVETSENCAVEPSESCAVETSENCAVEPSESCEVEPSKNCAVEPSESCAVETSESCAVETSENCAMELSGDQNSDIETEGEKPDVIPSESVDSEPSFKTSSVNCAEQESEMDSGDEQMDTSDIAIQSSEDELSTPVSWTREEDRILLEALQIESDIEDAFMKIRSRLTYRTMTQIKKRFETLMTLLQQMSVMKTPEK